MISNRRTVEPSNRQTVKCKPCLPLLHHPSTLSPSTAAKLYHALVDRAPVGLEAVPLSANDLSSSGNDKIQGYYKWAFVRDPMERYVDSFDAAVRTYVLHQYYTSTLVSSRLTIILTTFMMRK